MQKLITAPWFLPVFSILAASVFLTTHYNNEHWREVPTLETSNLHERAPPGETNFDTGGALEIDYGKNETFIFQPDLQYEGPADNEDTDDAIIAAFTYTPTQTPNEFDVLVPIPTSEVGVRPVLPPSRDVEFGENGYYEPSWTWKTDYPGQPTPDPALLIDPATPPSVVNRPSSTMDDSISENDNSPVHITWKTSYPGQPTPSPALLNDIPSLMRPSVIYETPITWKTYSPGQPTPDPAKLEDMPFLQDMFGNPTRDVEVGMGNDNSPITIQWQWNIPKGQPTPPPANLENAPPSQKVAVNPNDGSPVNIQIAFDTPTSSPSSSSAVAAADNDGSPVSLKWNIPWGQPTPDPVWMDSPATPPILVIKADSAPNDASPVNLKWTIPYGQPTPDPVWLSNPATPPSLVTQPTRQIEVATKTPTKAGETWAPTATRRPTNLPTKTPTLNPTDAPTTKAPTKSPTDEPTMVPTKNPTLSRSPTIRGDTYSPTSSPTTSSPSTTPTTSSPSSEPTRNRLVEIRTNNPTKSPTTASPTVATSEPTAAPTTPPPTPPPTIVITPAPVRPIPVPRPPPPPQPTTPVTPQVPLPTPVVPLQPTVPVQQVLPPPPYPIPVQPPFQVQQPPPYVWEQPPYPLQVQPPYQPYIPPPKVVYPPWQPYPQYYPGQQQGVVGNPGVGAIQPGWWITQQQGPPIPAVVVPVTPQPTPIPFYHNKHFGQCEPRNCQLNEDAEFHSLSHEDEAIYEIFYTNPIRCCLVIVEVGVGDGERFSFSKYFEDALKWRTLLIEANPDYYEKLKVNRPNATAIENGGFCESDYMEYYPQSQTFSMLGDSVEISSERHSPRPTTTSSSEDMKQIPCFKMEEIFQEHGITKVDVMVVHVQGDALAFIRAMDWTVRVDIWIVLMHDPTSNSEHYNRDLLTKSVLMRNEYVNAEWDIRRWCDTSMSGNCLNNNVFLRKGFNPLPCEYHPYQNSNNLRKNDDTTPIGRRRLMQQPSNNNHHHIGCMSHKF